jgi:hypothetical protein
MNKYLEKAAELSERLGKVDEAPKAKKPGSELVRGSKTLFDRAMLKKADMDPNIKKDLVNTGTIGALGTATGFAAHKGMTALPKIFGEGAKLHNAKIMAVSGIAGLAADYAGVKLNNAVNKNIS